MSNEPSEERWSTFTEGFVVPIAGLLALLFATMAGMSVLPALSGSPSDLATPVIFAAVALLSFRVRQRAIAAREDG
ncbi:MULTISPECIES: hypothetical protein [Natrinema]|uniref:Uncharacterized protein n=2 Tax=Natrinema TaxID=88723 RepID=A0A2A5QVM3_9EURY|nr:MULTISPECIES: hypothetical protein [Natrinema]MBZ6493873.1 hypothetical protein [Natrinema longum]PCR90898.1 hypothetical protein CP557_10430 [Natrinema ejinorense]QSW84791.1 hypothetical protein J0X27_15260 [Natrinema longum]